MIAATSARVMLLAGRKLPLSPWKTPIPVSTSTASLNAGVMSPSSPYCVPAWAALAVTIRENAITIARASARNFFKFLIGIVSSFIYLPEFRSFSAFLESHGISHPVRRPASSLQAEVIITTLFAQVNGSSPTVTQL
jgi:hypothetical protein